jgi:hypothetical protein
MTTTAAAEMKMGMGMVGHGCRVIGRYLRLWAAATPPPGWIST